MKAYILPIMFAVNSEQELCLLSSKDNALILPVRELEYPEFFQRETLTIVSNCFESGEFEIIEECNYNFLDVQNPLSVTYIERYFGDSISKEDFIFTYAGVLKYMKCISDLKWNVLNVQEQHGGFTKDKELNLLLAEIMQKMRI